MKTKYIAYYRVSTNKQNLGLDAQRTIILSYIKSQNNSELLGEYIEKESGKNNDRLELNKALSECKKENAILLISKIDRLSRSVSFIFSLKDSGVNFICCDMPELNTLTLGIFASLAQHERELISERTKAALNERKNTMKLGKPENLLNVLDTAISNSIATRKQKALNNENNIKAYSLIKSLLTQGYSWNRIAKELNSNGFKTSNNSKFYAKTVQLVYNLYER